MSKKDEKNNLEVQSRIEAGCQIYNSCIAEAKKITEAIFGAPSSYYDGEKKHVLTIAAQLFDMCVDRADVDKIAVPTLNVEKLKLKSKTPKFEDGKEGVNLVEIPSM